VFCDIDILFDIVNDLLIIGRLLFKFFWEFMTRLNVLKVCLKNGFNLVC